MRMICSVMVAVLLAVATPHAQKTEAERAQEVRKGNLKILIGLCSIGAGAFILPLSRGANSPNSNNASIGNSVGPGLGLMAIGSYVVWLGAVERQRAMQPQTTFGVAFGPTKAVQIRHSW
jgi:hypothetical protein